MTASWGDHACYYAYRGHPVIPLRGKLPLTANGLHDATTDPYRITDWWRRWPEANIGVRCSRAYVLDVDPRHGGSIALKRAIAMQGLMPETPLTRTGSGGWHLWWRPVELAEGETLRRHPLEGCDGCGPGHYVVVPPSVHPDTGKAYRWVRSLGSELPVMPGWLRELVVRPAPVATPALDVPVRDASRYALGALRKACEACRVAADGTKHTVLAREAWSIGGLVAAGAIDGAQVAAELLAAISRPGFTAADVARARKTIEQQMRAAPVRAVEERARG